MPRVWSKRSGSWQAPLAKPCRASPFTSKPEDAANADLVTESIPEDPDLKAKVFAEFNKICPPRAIFTTNTSTMLPYMYAEATGRPAQFAALHFHQSVRQTNLVDIMPHAGTGAETVELLRAFARRIGPGAAGPEERARALRDE